MGQTPPTISSHVGQVFEDLAGGVAFQAARDLGGVASLVAASRHVAAGFGVVGHAGEHDAVQRTDELIVNTVSAFVVANEAEPLLSRS